MKKEVIYRSTASGEEFHTDKDMATRSGVYDAIISLRRLTHEDGNDMKDMAEFDLNEIRAAAKDLITACDGGYIDEFVKVTRRKGK